MLDFFVNLWAKVKMHILTRQMRLVLCRSKRSLCKKLNITNVTPFSSMVSVTSKNNLKKMDIS